MALPSEYVRVDYIESNGTGFGINTGVWTTNGFRATAKVMWTSVPSTVGTTTGSVAEQILYNDGTNYYRSYFQTYVTTANNPIFQLGCYSFYNTGTTPSVSADTIYDVDFSTISGNGYFKINGTTYGTTTVTYSGTNRSVYLFKDGSALGYTATYMRYYNVQIYSDINTMVRDYIPVKRISDGELGLYDLLNDTFVTNSGSGTFTYGHELVENITFTDNPLSFTVADDVSLTAVFRPTYTITLTYDSTLGSASYYWDGSNVVLTATPNSDAQFLGWYINSVPISTSNPYTYTPTGDVTIEARFDEVFGITTSVNGSGAIDYTRGTDRNDVTLTVIPSANWSFEKYVVNGVEYTTTPLSIHLTQATSVTAYFVEDDKFHLTVNTNFNYGSIFLSDNDVYDGTVVTIWARPFPDYNFVRWSDGNTDNPRQITVTSNITLVAIYQRVADTNGIYQYRCYVKDQMALTDPPKAFMRVDTFDIKTDLLTNSNSTVTVLDTAENVNNGDVLVLYDPKGTTLYQGVVKSMEDRKITCSQMQSFYKGLWIYNVSPQDYLEHEIAVLLQDYADGKIYRSSYTDTLVAQRLGGITIDYVGSTTVSLPTDLDKDDNEQMTQKDMEKWIYELYENYGIIFDFEINLSGTNYVHIKVPSYPSVKVGNNMFAIQNMSPITTIEETNRLIIFAQNKTYRTTYVATKNGIVEAPSSTANRFDITNTKVVFSDDDVADLVANNLPETMYNHKVTFTLVVKNFLYEFGEFNLGGELDVWKDGDYYNTVLTGYEIKKESNQNIVSVDFTCGKVRVALTKLLTLRGGL